MKIPTTKANTNKQLTITISNFAGGSNNLIDQSRMTSNFAVESTNLMSVQNGLWMTRWGTNNYGHDLNHSPDGAQEYVKADGTTELIAVANGVVYKSTDGGAWTSISGATLTAGIQCYFLQMGGYDSSNTYHNYLYIANGTDPLTRYDGSALTQYNSLAAPTGLAASFTGSGLASGAFTYYGQVTALNQVGETIGSSEVSISVNALRENFDATKLQGISWRWGAVASATNYQLYISDTQGYESLLTSVNASNFTDDGSLSINPYVEIPNDNTTTAPKFISMSTSNNRIIATNDTNNLYKVYFSGTGRQIGAFSDFFGGGWINLERGGKEIPIAAKHYQSGTGQGTATILCKTTNGQGSVWQIDFISATVGGTTFTIPSASKIVGSFGTESLLGVVQATNNLMFPNEKGWFSLGTQAQYYGVLRTQEISSNIRTYWRNLIGSKLSGIASYFYDAKIFISVPTSTVGNDRLIIFNEEVGNWSVDSTVGAKQFLEYKDTSGNSHFLFIPTSGTKLVEISPNFINDNGKAFNQTYVSPLLPVTKDMTTILSHMASIVELAQPKGTIFFQLLGVDKDNNFSTIASTQIINANYGSNTGIGSDFPTGFYPTSTNINVKGGAGSWAIYYTATPKNFTQAIIKKAIKRKAKLYAIQYKVFSTGADTQWTLNTIQTKGAAVQRRIPSSWVNS